MATTSAISRQSIRSTAFPTARSSLSDSSEPLSVSFPSRRSSPCFVITRILLQFSLQQVGVIVLRIRRPDLPRPFRIPLYPLPPLAAMAGFGFLLIYRVHALKELAVAAAIAASGTILYLFRAHRLRQWPFVSQPESPIP